MRMIAFLPWMNITNSINLEEFMLHPYQINKQTSLFNSNEIKIINNALKPYFIGDRQLNSATILSFKNENIIKDYSEEERAVLFVFSELLAISGIISREYFSYSDYQNRDNFRVIIQSFSGNNISGAAITSRKRDGSTVNYLPIASFRIQKPENIKISTNNNIDRNLLTALLHTREANNWSQIYESIVSFNLANTDHELFSEYIELILLVSAFERLLGCNKGKENSLAKAFTKIFVSENPITKDKCSILQSHKNKDKFPNFDKLYDIWIRDLFRLRGKAAHGKIKNGYNSVWSLSNHLLLSTYIFPYILKAKLNEHQFYQLSGEDKNSFEFFEHLLCEDLFEKPKDRHDLNSYPWNIISQKFEQEKLRRTLEEKLSNLYKNQSNA